MQQSFEEYFNNIVAPELKTLKKAKQPNIIWTVIYAIFAMYLAVKMLAIYDLNDVISRIINTLILCGLGFLGLLVFVFTNIKALNFNKIELKYRTLELVFGYFGKTTRFMRFDTLSTPQKEELNYYKNIKLLEKITSTPYIDDALRIDYKGVPIYIEEMYCRQNDKDLFKGLLISLQQNKNIKSPVIIKNNTPKLKELGCAQQVIALEDNEFNTVYTVTANEQIEARYLLTTSFMERLKELNKNGINIGFCAQDDMFYICIAKAENLFEPNLHKDMSLEAAKNLIKEIKDVILIVDGLKLNENIGL